MIALAVTIRAFLDFFHGFHADGSTAGCYFTRSLAGFAGLDFGTLLVADTIFLYDLRITPAVVFHIEKNWREASFQIYNLSLIIIMYSWNL